MPTKSKVKNYGFLSAYILKGYRMNGLLVHGDTSTPILWGKLVGPWALDFLS